jgi:uncharacterized protein YjbJ (UPF0337 family)
LLLDRSGQRLRTEDLAPVDWVATFAPELERSLSMNVDTIRGKWEQIKGRIRSEYGKRTGHVPSRLKGSAQEGAGKIQEGVGRAKDASRRADTPARKN